MWCQRFESEVAWRAQVNRAQMGGNPKQHPAIMIDRCKRAKRDGDDDLFEHCQPQVTSAKPQVAVVARR